MTRIPLLPRVTVIALCCAAVFSTAGCGASICRDTWFGPGKAEHFAAGFALGATTSTLTGYAGWNRATSTAVGLGTVAVAGTTKETIDLHGAAGCWSWKELTWEMLGGAVGSAVGTVVSH